MEPSHKQPCFCAACRPQDTKTGTVEATQAYKDFHEYQTALSSGKVEWSALSLFPQEYWDELNGMTTLSRNVSSASLATPVELRPAQKELSTDGDHDTTMKAEFSSSVSIVKDTTISQEQPDVKFTYQQQQFEVDKKKPGKSPESDWLIEDNASQESNPKQSSGHRKVPFRPRREAIMKSTQGMSSANPALSSIETTAIMNDDVDDFSAGLFSKSYHYGSRRKPKSDRPDPSNKGMSSLPDLGLTLIESAPMKAEDTEIDYNRPDTSPPSHQSNKIQHRRGDNYDHPFIILDEDSDEENTKLHRQEASRPRAAAYTQSVGYDTTEIPKQAYDPKLIRPLECYPMADRTFDEEDDPTSDIHASDLGDASPPLLTGTFLECRAGNDFLSQVIESQALSMYPKVQEELQRLVFGLQMDHVVKVFIPMRLNYIRYAFVQISFCLTLHSHTLGLSAFEAEAYIDSLEKTWFRYSKYLEYLFTGIYEAIQESVEEIPDVFNQHCVTEGRDPQDFLSKVAAVFYQDFAENSALYDMSVADAELHWKEDTRLFQNMLQEVSPDSVELLRSPFSYQPTWKPYTLKEADSGEFPQLPTLPDLPREKIAVGKLAKAYSHWEKKPAEIPY